MISSPLRLGAFFLALLLLVGATTADEPSVGRGHSNADSQTRDEKQVGSIALTVQYLEIVTPSVNETCDALAQVHDLVFGEPIAQFGNARTAPLKNGGLIGVRAPLRESEEPIVRPYVLVDDIDAAVKAAETAGATVAMPPTEIPGGGKFSIYILGGIEHGLWQL